MAKNRKVQSSNFVDYVKIYCASGNGGAGAVHFRREKFVAKGGPDGGDGGRGGHIILRGNQQMWTLLHLKYRKHIKADHGKPGGKQCATGKSGSDIILDVPLGTVAKDADTGTTLFEVTEEGQEMILAEGGIGGLGNWHFKNSTQQTPRYAQPGTPGKENWFILELKVLADVGLVGFPNAGKSTLLSVVSAAKPEIADYAFTTLTPNLGIVAYRDAKSFVMADIPGIIEGASEGKGLGHQFLRHIERNSVLLFLIPADSQDHYAEYQILERELEQYNEELMHKDRIVAISKSDMLDDELMHMISATFPKGLPHVFFSSVSQKNITTLKDLLWSAINRAIEGEFTNDDEDA
jgi:GTP-binding protein